MNNSVEQVNNIMCKHFSLDVVTLGTASALVTII